MMRNDWTKILLPFFWKTVIFVFCLMAFILIVFGIANVRKIVFYFLANERINKEKLKAIVETLGVLVGRIKNFSEEVILNYLK